jgi:TetR/AcrR family transcriptional regulator, transcriptional repressor for nem operon
MRYPRIHKRLSRQRIIRAAARAFNRRGFDGIGIADIMKEAGLTQGAFSGHFSSKDELIREAIDDAFGKSIFIKKELKNRPLDELLSEYLSLSHRDEVEDGCPASTLTADVSRLPRRPRESFLVHVRQILSSIESRLPDTVRGANRRTVAMSLFALLLGAIQLSRASGGTQLSEAMIEAAMRGASGLIGKQGASSGKSVLARPARLRRSRLRSRSIPSKRYAPGAKPDQFKGRSRRSQN